MYKSIVTLTALGLLAACASPVHVDEATPPSVTLAHEVGYEYEADRNAYEYCQDKYGLEAEIVHRGPHRTVYDCVRFGERFGYNRYRHR